MAMPLKSKASTLLREDHAKVQGLFQSYQEILMKAPGSDEEIDLGEEICKELEIHAWLEERLAYPALAQVHPDPALILQFAQDHREIKQLISRWRLAQGQAAGAPGSDASLARIMAHVQTHVAEEESRALPALALDPVQDDELGSALAKLKLKLKMFPPVQRCIELRVPVRKAYNQWTQFEAFPGFLDDVKAVRQLDDAHVRWVVEVAGKELSWTAEIHEQFPDRRIAWRSVEGASNAGAVTFLPLTPDTTRMLVELTYEPKGLLEDLGALMGLVSQRVAAELEHFKKFIEALPEESGAWRGRIAREPLDPNLVRTERREQP